MGCFRPSPDSPHCCRQKETSNAAGALDLDQRRHLACDSIDSSGKTATIIQEGSATFRKGSAMPENIDDLLPTVKDIQKQAALKEADKAGEYMQRLAAAEAEKRALIEKLSKPSGLSEDEKIKLASNVIQRAVRNGLTEVQVYRFPNSLCTDNGRAINQQEPGWEKTLTGIAHEIFQLWSDYLKPRGYRIRYQIIDFPGGLPGDISIVIAWQD
jgi:hypothetical protein